MERKIKEEPEVSAKELQAKKIHNKCKIVRFVGSVLYQSADGWNTLTSDDFARVCYETLGFGMKQAQIKDLQHLFFTTADDMTEYVKYIAMPDGRVWDKEDLAFNPNIPSEDCIYTAAVSPTDGDRHRQWLEEIALGDRGLADDIIKAIAPIFMHKKPFGLFWFVGSGANGKSTVLKALYAMFGSKPPYTFNKWFSQLTVKQIEDERDTPMLNGKLGNICLESNDGHVKDTGGYKNLAEHSSFYTHKFNSQDGLLIDGNVHTIFNTNNIPTFADKTQGVRRRTFTIPFKTSFPQDSTFDERLFNTEGVLSDLLGEILRATVILKDSNYKYSFSHATSQAKEDYDEEVNSAETYFADLLDTDILGFTNFDDLTNDYHQWCNERSYIALGKRIIGQAAKVAGYRRTSFRLGDKVMTRYVRDDYDPLKLVELSRRWGLFQKEDSPVELDTEEHNTDKTYQELMRLL
jgi:phage/plasmid-associated DNA primase